jgi:DNA-binding IclR family transcriptional regulator
VVERAARRARTLVHDDTEDPVLTTLRHIGPATTAELPTALDKPAADIRAVLRTLVAAGLVSRTGHARTTKYHA